MPIIFRLRVILFLLLAFPVVFGAPASAKSSIQQPLHFIDSRASLLKPGRPNLVVSIIYKLLQDKRSKSIAAIAFGFLATLLLTFIIFSAAYGGATGGVVALIAINRCGLNSFWFNKDFQSKEKKTKQFLNLFCS
jgi:hypothetical protein